MISPKKKIIFIVTSNELDGPSRVIYELSAALRHQFLVTVYVPIIPRYKLFVLQSCKNLGWFRSLIKRLHYCCRWVAIDLVFRKLRWVKAAECKVQLKRCIFSPSRSSLNAADYVLLNAWYQTLHFSDYWELNKNKFIVCHWHYEEYQNESIISLRDKIVNHCRSITCSRNSSSSIASKNLRKPHVVSMGINQKVFYSKGPDCKIQERSIDIALYRGFEKRKGFHVGLEAMQNIADKQKLKCCIIQGSKRAKTPWAYPIYAELSDVELAHILRDTKIFLFPSLFEGFGMPPLEAMGCGCAVITTGVGGIPDYTRHMEDAYIVEPGQVSEIEYAISFLLDNRDAMQRMQEKAAEKAANFTWKEAARGFTDILDS